MNNSGHCMVSLENGGDLFITGGYGGSKHKFHKMTHIYKDSKGTWELIHEPMPRARMGKYNAPLSEAHARQWTMLQCVSDFVSAHNNIACCHKDDVFGMCQSVKSPRPLVVIKSATPPVDAFPNVSTLWKDLRRLKLVVQIYWDTGILQTSIQNPDLPSSLRNDNLNSINFN